MINFENYINNKNKKSGFGISYSEVNDLMKKDEELYNEALKIFSNFYYSLN